MAGEGFASPSKVGQQCWVRAAHLWTQPDAGPRGAPVQAGSTGVLRALRGGGGGAGREQQWVHSWWPSARDSKENSREGPGDAPGRDQGCGQGWGRTCSHLWLKLRAAGTRPPTGAPTQWCWFGTTALYWHCLFLQWPWNVTLLLNPPPYNRSALKPSNRWLRWWRNQRPRFYPWMGKIPWKRK